MIHVLGLVVDYFCWHLVEGELLEEQVKDIKQTSVYVSQLRRVGKGHGVFHFDRELEEEA